MDNIKQVIRDCALKRMKSHSMSQSVEVSEIPADYSRTVHGNWMGLILVSGADVRITFKVHFDTKNVRAVMSKMLACEPETINPRLALDFVKEFCNLTGGFLKQVFEENQSPIVTGISLPIVTKGFDDLFYQPSTKDELNDIWVLRIDDVPIYCTPHVNIYDQSKLSTVAIPTTEESVDDDDGDIDFL